MNRLLLTNAMTPSNSLFLNSRVPIGTDKVDLAIIGLQIQTFTPSLDLQDKNLVTSLQRFTASPSSAIKWCDILDTFISQSGNNGVNLFAKMTKD
jgi:hypothetical protein